jgi:adenosine kinase
MSFVITGSVAYDYLMRFPGRFRDQILPDQLDNLSLSFLADSMRRAQGGIAANIAYTMRLLGGDPIILATVGVDFGDYRRWLEAEGLSTEQIIEIPDELTATFFVSTDLDQNQIANFYAGAMNYARHYTLASRGLTHARMVVISPNDPVAMLNYAQECKQHGIPFAYDPSQQIARLSGEELERSVPGAAYLLCNEYELAMVQSKTGWTLADLREQVDTLVLTLGKKGSVIYHGDEETTVPAASLARLDDPTGAGDAYRGGFFAARMAGLPLAVSGRVGSLCSAYALEHMGTTTHRFTLDEFIERYTHDFGPEPALDALRQPAQVASSQ